LVIAVLVKPDLSDLAVMEAKDGNVISLGASAFALGPPSDEHSRVVG
jgi:hypothetical protein